MRRGYLFTIVSYLLVFSLFLLAFSFYRVAQDERGDAIILKSMDKVALIHDDVGTELSPLLDLDISFSNSSGNTTININESFGGLGYLSDISDYLDYATGDYQSLVAANISLGINYSFGITDMDVNFAYPDENGSAIEIFGMDVILYDVVIIVDIKKEKRTVDRQAGDLPAFVGFYYSDGTQHWPPWVPDRPSDRYHCNKYIGTFKDGTVLNVSLGGCGENPDSLIIEAFGNVTETIINIETDVEWDEDTFLIYDNPLLIRDWASDANKTSEPLLID